MIQQLEQLAKIRSQSGNRQTEGLPNTVLESFLKHDPSLRVAVDLAVEEFHRLTTNESTRVLLKKDEKDQILEIQNDYVNFYSEDSVNPYVALSAHGPWIVTTTGAVIYDTGGYGMLGLGHSPQSVIRALAKPHVMANIMTANEIQKKFSDRMFKEIGFRRDASTRKAFAKFICLNSGSEAMTVASRISDVNAAKQTATGGRHSGKTIKFLALKGAFHGRTDRPSQVSDSSLPKYREFLASFKNRNNLIVIEPNNVAELKAAFDEARKNQIFIESVWVEPVMGEGNPGQGLSPEFYKIARELTSAEGSLLIVDSIQASLRAHGCLSIVDYPGFEQLAPPDIESYSKALNAGQFPLSVLSLSEAAASLYIKGIYGNTMTTNPRGLDVALAVLDSITPALRRNIQERGVEFVNKLTTLQKEFPDVIEGVKGTGLLVSCAIVESKFKVVGINCLEDKMRKKGVGVIHGGKNSLRFTPHFAMTSAEVNLIIDVLKNLLTN